MQKAYDTRGSQDVSDPSTSRAQRCLTCQIGRDGVFSTRYGRKRLEKGMINYWKCSCIHTRSRFNSTGSKIILLNTTPSRLRMCFFLQFFHDDKSFFSAGDSVRASPYKLLRVGVHVNVEYPSWSSCKCRVSKLEFM